MVRPTLALALVLAGCSQPQSSSAPPVSNQCASLDQALTPERRAAFTQRVARALPPDAGDAAVLRVLESGPWSAVWAEPANLERGVFFFNEGLYVETWGGLVAPGERNATAAWARALPGSPPANLAECFADALAESGTP